MPRKNNAGNAGEKERQYAKLESFEVRNARTVRTKKGTEMCYATLVLNGIAIYNCRAVTYTAADGTEKDFISWPEQKGSDGEYYKLAYAPLSTEDQQRICDAIYAAIDNKN